MNCKKCKSGGSVILRKKDIYCENCFISNTNHKFRACIGKNKILSSNDNVLICVSGGLGSSVIMDLTHSGIAMDNHKKFRIIPHFLHLIGTKSEKDTQVAKVVMEQCKKYNFNVYIAHISNYLETDHKLPEMNTIPHINSETEQQFYAMLKSMPATASNDLLHKINRNLFIRFAKLLECKFIFTAETTTTLAINLLSNLAIGRGSQVENDIGFCDARDEDIKLLRPMRDISKEELDHYVNIKQLISVQHDDIKQSSLQSVIKTFVTDLQESFQATISTVCKTADKIGVHDGHEKRDKCIICDSYLGTENFNLTALDATNFSKTVSNERAQIPEGFQAQDTNKSMFPFVHKRLCYGCSRNYSEMDKSILPNHVQTLFT